MPNQDRTGPNGKGSQTGRGLGKCNPNQSSDDNKTYGNGGGRGNGQGQGQGRGQGRGNGQNNK